MKKLLYVAAVAVALACVFPLIISVPAQAQSTTPFADRASAQLMFGGRCMMMGVPQRTCECFDNLIRSVMRGQAEVNTAYFYALGDHAAYDQAYMRINDKTGFGQRMTIIDQRIHGGACTPASSVANSAAEARKFEDRCTKVNGTTAITTKRCACVGNFIKKWFEKQDERNAMYSVVLADDAGYQSALKLVQDKQGFSYRRTGFDAKLQWTCF